MVGEPVRAAKYHKVIQTLQRLNQIPPSMRSAELEAAMEPYKRDVNPYEVVRKPGIIDTDGRAYGVGRRKSSSAKVYIVQGDGQVLINGKSINAAFGRIHDRESALWALKVTNRMDKYNVWALVRGGGSTGQAEAITLGTARALMVHEPDLKPALRRGEIICNSAVSFTILTFSSGLRYKKPKKGREKEARKTQGKENACLGQEIEGHLPGHRFQCY